MSLCPLARCRWGGGWTGEERRRVRRCPARPPGPSCPSCSGERPGGAAGRSRLCGGAAGAAAGAAPPRPRHWRSRAGGAGASLREAGAAGAGNVLGMPALSPAGCPERLLARQGPVLVSDGHGTGPGTVTRHCIPQPGPPWPSAVSLLHWLHCFLLHCPLHSKVSEVL